MRHGASLCGTVRRRPAQRISLQAYIYANFLQATAMAEAALRNDDLAEAEVECAPKVLELVLQACRGRVDACVGHYIALALDRRGRRPGQPGARSLALTGV